MTRKRGQHLAVFLLVLIVLGIVLFLGIDLEFGITGLTFVEGNESTVALTNVSSLAISINGSALNTATNYSGSLMVEFYGEGSLLASFTWDFDNDVLNLSNVSIERSFGGLAVNGVNAIKTMLVDKRSSNNVCVKDVDGASISSITSNCTGSGEAQVVCDGTLQSGYVCSSYNATTFSVSGLANSAVLALEAVVLPSPAISSVKPNMLGRGANLTINISGENFSSPNISFSNSDVVVISKTFINSSLLLAYVYVKGNSSLGNTSLNIVDVGGNASFADAFEVGEGPFSLNHSAVLPPIIESNKPRQISIILPLGRNVDNNTLSIAGGKAILMGPDIIEANLTLVELNQYFARLNASVNIPVTGDYTVVFNFTYNQTIDCVDCTNFTLASTTPNFVTSGIAYPLRVLEKDEFISVLLQTFTFAVPSSVVPVTEPLVAVTISAAVIIAAPGIGGGPRFLMLSTTAGACILSSGSDVITAAMFGFPFGPTRWTCPLATDLTATVVGFLPGEGFTFAPSGDYETEPPIPQASSTGGGGSSNLVPRFKPKVVKYGCYRYDDFSFHGKDIVIEGNAPYTNVHVEGEFVDQFGRPVQQKGRSIEIKVAGTTKYFGASDSKGQVVADFNLQDFQQKVDFDYNTELTFTTVPQPTGVTGTTYDSTAKGYTPLSTLTVIRSDNPTVTPVSYNGPDPVYEASPKCPAPPPTEVPACPTTCTTDADGNPVWTQGSLAPGGGCQYDTITQAEWTSGYVPSLGSPEPEFKPTNDVSPGFDAPSGEEAEALISGFTGAAAFGNLITGAQAAPPTPPPPTLGGVGPGVYSGTGYGQYYYTPGWGGGAAGGGGGGVPGGGVTGGPSLPGGGAGLPGPCLDPEPTECNYQCTYNCISSLYYIETCVSLPPDPNCPPYTNQYPCATKPGSWPTAPSSLPSGMAPAPGIPAGAAQGFIVCCLRKCPKAEKTTSCSPGGVSVTHYEYPPPPSGGAPRNCPPPPPDEFGGPCDFCTEEMKAGTKCGTVQTKLALGVIGGRERSFLDNCCTDIIPVCPDPKERTCVDPDVPRIRTTKSALSDTYTYIGAKTGSAGPSAVAPSDISTVVKPSDKITGGMIFGMQTATLGTGATYIGGTGQIPIFINVQKTTTGLSATTTIGSTSSGLTPIVATKFLPTTNAIPPLTSLSSTTNPNEIIDVVPDACVGKETCEVKNGQVVWSECQLPEGITVANCYPVPKPRCGDSKVDAGEDCDDGNTVSCDGCSYECKKERCGDNFVCYPELCEPPNTLTCDSACRAIPPPACGDGTLDVITGEQCDDGNLMAGDGCSPGCIIEICGNLALDPGEGCDDGNTLSGDGCDSVCQLEGCGNNVIDTGEQCDPPNQQGNCAVGQICDNTCACVPVPPVCGNNIKETGEQCDGTDASSCSSGQCRPDCTCSPITFSDPPDAPPNSPPGLPPGVGPDGKPVTPTTFKDTCVYSSTDIKLERIDSVDPKLLPGGKKLAFGVRALNTGIGMYDVTAAISDAFSTTDAEVLRCTKEIDEYKCAPIEKTTSAYASCAGMSYDKLLYGPPTKELQSPASVTGFVAVAKLLTPKDNTILQNNYVLQLRTGSANIGIGPASAPVPKPELKNAVILNVMEVSLPSGVEHLPAFVTLPLPDPMPSGVDQYSIRLFVWNVDHWEFLESSIPDLFTNLISAEVSDLRAYAVDNKVIFAVIASTCYACTESKFDLVYDGGGEKAIVLVHGLTSNGVGTWAPLIKEIEIAKLPVQVYVFSYPTWQKLEAISQDLADNLETLAGKYKIFPVGHSVGGLVVEHALYTSYIVRQNEPEKYKYLDKVKNGAVILLGAPNKGTPVDEVWKNLFAYILKVKMPGSSFNLHSPLLKDAVSGRQIPPVPDLRYFVIAGTKPLEFNLGFFRITTEEVLELFNPNDGMIPTDSAYTIGTQEFNDLCRNYFEVNLDHIQLNDHDLALKIIQRIINQQFHDAADEDVSWPGYSNYVNFKGSDWKVDDLFIIASSTLPQEQRAGVPPSCGCGNGVCGEGEDPFTCPTDCFVSRANTFCVAAPIWIYILLALSILVFIVHVVRKRKTKEEQKNTHAALYILLGIALLLALLMLLICKYIPLWVLLAILVMLGIVTLEGHVGKKQEIAGKPIPLPKGKPLPPPAKVVAKPVPLPKKFFVPPERKSDLDEYKKTVKEAGKLLKKLDRLK